MSIEECTQNIQSAFLRLKQAEAVASHAYEHYLDDLQLSYQQRLQQIEETFQTATRQARVVHQEQSANIQKTFDQAIQELQTPLAASFSTLHWMLAAWDDLGWENYKPSQGDVVPSAVRVGRLALPDGASLTLPALIPLVGQGHVYVIGNDPEATRRIVQVLLLRAVLATTPGALRLSLVDPLGLGSHLADFLRLPATLRGDTVAARAEEIERLLEALVTHIETVIRTRLVNLYPTITEYNAAKPELAVPYQLLALPDLPAGLNERAAEHLRRIAQNGPRAGVYIVASLNPAHPPPRNLDLAALTNLGTTLQLATPDRLTWSDPEFGQYPVEPDVLPPVERINQWLDAIAQAIQQTSTVLPFRRVATAGERHWTGNTTDGLRVPIGLDSAGALHHFTLGQDVVHHALIGGTIGSGKSNLLHVLITQMALAYPPAELDLYLVDFKEGVEFQDYMRLPHARAVALESEREFGLSIIRRLHAEMEGRGRLYKAAGSGINDLVEYRRQTGQVLPRCVLIMDEFQVLFSEDDGIAREAGRLLEDVVRRGRVFGIHVMLSSQSPAIEGMYRNRLYNQIGLRIALRCRAQDAQAILGEGNDAARQLEQRGEAIYNAAMGDAAKNVRIRVALLPGQERQQILATIQALGQGRAYPLPLTFESRAPARLEENAELQTLLAQTGWPAHRSSVPVWLGQPVEIKPVTAAILERYARSNLVIAGGNEEQGYGLLLATLISLSAQHAPNHTRLIVADFARPDSPVAGLLPRVVALPHQPEVVGARQAGPLVNQLVTLVTQRLNGEIAADTEIYFCIAGLQRWRELRPDDPLRPTEIAKNLLRIAEEGPEVGVHLIVWTDSVAALERALKRGSIGLFDLRVALRLSESDSNALIGSPLAARMDDNRALFRHEDWEVGRVEKFKPYTVPTEDVFDQMLIRLQQKQGKT